MDDPEVTMEYSLITNVSNDLSDVSNGLSNGSNNSSKKLENLNDPEASRVFRLVSNISMVYQGSVTLQLILHI